MTCLILLGITLGIIFIYFVMLVWLILHCRIWDLERKMRMLEEKNEEENFKKEAEFMNDYIAGCAAMDYKIYKKQKKQ